MTEVYKQINHELILSNQECKKNISLLQQEIIYLNSKLLDERANAAKLKVHCVKILTKSFADLIEAVDPENDILHLIKAAGNINGKLKKKSASQPTHRKTMNSSRENSNTESLINKSVQNVEPVSGDIVNSKNDDENDIFHENEIENISVHEEEKLEGIFAIAEEDEKEETTNTKIVEKDEKELNARYITVRSRGVRVESRISGTLSPPKQSQEKTSNLFVRLEKRSFERECVILKENNVIANQQICKEREIVKDKQQSNQPPEIDTKNIKNEMDIVRNSKARAKRSKKENSNTPFKIKEEHPLYKLPNRSSRCRVSMAEPSLINKLRNDQSK